MSNIDNSILNNNPESRQLFKHPWLERMTRTHIAVPLTIFFLYSAGLLIWSFKGTTLSIQLTLTLFFLGWFVFTWVEYQVHRHLFHIATFNEWRKKFQYLVHGVHHKFPKDKDRLAMPPVLCITIATLFFLLFKLIIGTYVFAFLPGFLIGYAYYLLIHYLVHAHQPPKNRFKKLWINHSIHHYKDGDISFGVSSSFWDRVYGTHHGK